MMRYGPGVPMPLVMAAITSVLERKVTRNALLGGAEAQPGTPFHGKFVLPISIGKYLERLFWYADCSVTCWVGAFLYLDRFLEKQKPPLLLDPNTVHRILLPSVLVAIKFFDHVKYRNDAFATMGCLSLKELNYLEREFLSGIKYQLFVTNKEYIECCYFLQCELNYLKVWRPLMPPPFIMLIKRSEQEQEKEQLQLRFL